jgi:tetratricopeptide (TPR) repeat protein
MAYLGLADSLKGMEKLDKAIEAYSKVIELDSVSQSVGLMKRGLLYMQLKHNEKALVDFNMLVAIAEDNP